MSADSNVSWSSQASRPSQVSPPSQASLPSREVFTTPTLSAISTQQLDHLVLRRSQTASRSIMQKPTGRKRLPSSKLKDSIVSQRLEKRVRPNAEIAAIQTAYENNLETESIPRPAKRMGIDKEFFNRARNRVTIRSTFSCLCYSLLGPLSNRTMKNIYF